MVYDASFQRRLIRLTRDLSKRASAMRFGPPVAFVYNPLDYARETAETYLRRFAGPQASVLLVGMNPGPWGMAQTGVPFGAVDMVRDWMGIEGKVKRPPSEHPKRPILGFDCPRTEVSGTRLWSWARDRYGTPDAFFDEFFVWNYCPLCFMAEAGTNVTPDKLKKPDREQLLALCDTSLRRVIDLVDPDTIVGVGKFAEARVRAVLGADSPVRVGTILHPSPANPRANREWEPVVDAQLREIRAS